MEVPDLSPNEIKLDLILADYAKVADGKLDLLGGGWSFWNGQNVGPSAVAILAKVPSSWAGQEVELDLQLVDEDGHVVTHAPHPKGKLIVGPGDRPGVPSDFKMALNMAPFPLVPGRSYTWQVSVDGETRSDWSVTFFVKPVGEDQGRLRPTG